MAPENSGSVLSITVFGPGHGESILVTSTCDNGRTEALIVDAFATSPHDSAETNPIIDAQNRWFRWGDVQGICLTHAHEDHFAGLVPVARRCSEHNPEVRWIWPSGIPLESIVRMFKALDAGTGYTAPHGPNWIAQSIEQLAQWSEVAEPFQVLPGREITIGTARVRFLAPTDTISAKYARAISRAIASGMLDEYKAPSPDLHNTASAGMVVDLPNLRVLLLGDMVKDSWDSALRNREVMSILEERKADLVKLPHHCSENAVYDSLLRRVCDPARTIAVFTPFRLGSPPPHESAVEKAREHVHQLWCTVRLPREGGVWDARGAPMEARALLAAPVHQARKAMADPRECYVRFEVDPDGRIRTRHGNQADPYFRRNELPL